MSLSWLARIIQVCAISKLLYEWTFVSISQFNGYSFFVSLKQNRMRQTKNKWYLHWIYWSGCAFPYLLVRHPASSGYLFNTTKNESTPPESNCSVIFEWQTISVAFLYIVPFVCSCLNLHFVFFWLCQCGASNTFNDKCCDKARVKSDISLEEEWINFCDFNILFFQGIK